MIRINEFNFDKFDKEKLEFTEHNIRNILIEYAYFQHPTIELQNILENILNEKIQLLENSKFKILFNNNVILVHIIYNERIVSIKDYINIIVRKIKLKQIEHFNR